MSIAVKGSCPLVISKRAMLLSQRSNRQKLHSCCSEEQSSSGSSVSTGNLAASGMGDHRLASLVLPIREIAFSQIDPFHVPLSGLIHGHRNRGHKWD